MDLNSFVVFICSSSNFSNGTRPRHTEISWCYQKGCAPPQSFHNVRKDPNWIWNEDFRCPVLHHFIGADTVEYIFPATGLSQEVWENEQLFLSLLVLLFLRPGQTCHYNLYCLLNKFCMHLQYLKSRIPVFFIHGSKTWRAPGIDSHRKEADKLDHMLDA